MAESDALLQVHGLTKAFGGLTAVDNVDFAVERGQIYSIIGPNGAGKTTVFNLITGIYKPSAGTIIFNGRPLTGSSPDRVLRRGITRTFQNIRLFNNMSVLENVLVGQHTTFPGDLASVILHLPNYRQAERRAKARAIELLSFFGPSLVARQDDYAASLSYADRRRVEIARALGSSPKMLLLDEPTAGMNDSETAEAIGYIQRLRQDFQLTILLIEHKLQVTMGISDRISVLDYGRKIAEGAPAEIQRNELVIEAYLGRKATVE
ncbi:MAG: ABC transporter ATP-binding protein [Ktedonobacterales bacterium]|nr:ABC transporter ATP-binding protein [Ktedonobacterales bacterium]